MSENRSVIMQRHLQLLVPIISVIACGVLICLLFASGVGAGYLFDDMSSVVPLRQLQSYPQLFWEAVFSDSSGPLGRPITILTYAIEQRFFLAEPSFSQGVSIGFHLVNTVLVFALVHGFLQAYKVRNSLLFAVFAALLWACAPQKISTVLYISQRMAILSTFFVLVSLISYFRARQASVSARQIFWYLVCGVSIIAAPFAKENGVLAIPLIAMLELFTVPYAKTHKAFGGHKRVAGCILLLGGAFFLALGFREFLQAEASYTARNFSFQDRLGSTPAVLADYARQFFIPDTARMGVINDDYPIDSIASLSVTAISTACIWLIGIAYLLVCAVRKKTSLPAFAIGFFLVGHSIESFYLPLELYFEHRNYLPSVGLALLFATVVSAMSERNAEASRGPAIALAAVYIASIVFSSYALAAHWRSPEALLEHDAAGHPRSSRVIADLALTQASRGETRAARDSIDQTFILSRSQPAARPMGTADPALLNIVVSCLASEHALTAVPAVGTFSEDDPIRSSSLRVLRQLHDNKACPGFAWGEVSDWLKSLVSSALEGGHKVRVAALVDLIDFEKALGNPLKSFIYASMASERDSRPTILLRLAEAAIALNDTVSFNKTLSALETMSEEGRLSGLEQRLLARLKQADSAS